MSILLDLFIIAIIAVSVILSAKHGFVRTLIEVIGFVAAFVIAFAVSGPLADVTYDRVIKPAVISSVDEGVQAGGAEVADKMWDSIPDFAKNYISGIGISEESLKKEAGEMSGSAGQIANEVSDKTVKPAVSKILGIIYSAVIAIILLVISKILAKLINKLIDFSIVGKINRVLGGAIGILKGAACALIICMVISVAVVLSKNAFGIFTAENIESTLIFKIFYGISPFV